MKTNLLKSIAFAMVMTTLYNCSMEPVEQLQPERINETSVSSNSLDPVTPCDGQNPKSRVTNNSDVIVNFEIFDDEGNLISYVYGLNPGEISEWKSFPIGITTFTVSTSETTKPVRIDMGTCMVYDVAINENKQLDTDVPIQL